MENDVFALIFFLSLIWCRYGAAELAPGLPVLAGSSAPGLAAPPGSSPLGRPRTCAAGERAHGLAAPWGRAPLGWPRRQGACPWAGHTAQGAPCTCLCATGSGSSGIVFFSMAGRPWPCSNPPPKISEPEREDGGINDIFPTFSLREYEK